MDLLLPSHVRVCHHFQSKLPFLVDVIFTVAVVNSVNVVFWRCVWELQDLIILPDNLEISVIVSLVVGYVLTYLCYLLQYPLDALFRILRNEKGHCFFVCLLFVDILFTFITAFAAICTWRGLWMNFHLHMWPSQLYYSFWIGHGVGFMGLSLVGGANNIPVRGAIIDANKETGCLSIEFFRSYFAQSESDDKSSKITNTKETLVIESVSTTVWKNLWKKSHTLSSQTTFSNAFLRMQYLVFCFEFHWEFVLQGPFDTKSALAQVMAWHRRGDKPLPEQMFAEFTDAYMGYWWRWVKSQNVVCHTSRNRNA